MMEKMDKRQAEEFSQGLNQIGTGWYRQILLAAELGVPKLLGYETLEKWVYGRLGGYRKYAVKERRRIIIELKQEGKSQREIAAVLGVDHRTIGNDLQASGENSPVNDGKRAKSGENSPIAASPPTPSAASRSDSKSVSNDPVTAGAIRKHESHPESEEPEFKSNMVNRLQSLTGEIEWYTPIKYIESVRKVLGTIELDPASSEIANQIVKAKKYYTQEQNGLTRSWNGKVFLNPPYAMPYVKQFVAYLVSEYSAERIEEAILLTNAATDTSWYDIAYESASAKCDTLGRISFLGNVQGEFQECTAPACGQTFFYFGEFIEKFAEEFRRYGRISVELEIT